jgi:hypothetical protein
MDQTALVTDQRVPGRELVDRLKAAGFPVSAAFWYWDEEAQEERLAIVSPRTDETGPRSAYEQIEAVLEEHPELAPLSLLARISVISPLYLRNALVHGQGLGAFDRVRDATRAQWIEGGSPALWLSRLVKERPKTADRS